MVMLSLVNAQRVHRHIAPVSPLPPRIGHCTEYRPMQCVERLGVDTMFVGVITSWGTLSPRAAIRAWLHSPPHKKIMLDPKYTKAVAFSDGGEKRVVFIT